MKLNNRGFAVSTILYLLLIMGVILITLTLTLLSSRRLVLEKLKAVALDNIYQNDTISYREALKILKEECINYARENSIENGTIKISDLNSTITEETLKEYKLINRNMIVSYDSENDTYEVNLEELK